MLIYIYIYTSDINFLLFFPSRHQEAWAAALQGPCQQKRWNGKSGPTNEQNPGLHMAPFRTLTCPWPAFGSHWLEPPIHLQDVPVVYAQTLLQALHKVQEGILSIGSSPKSLPLWDLSKLHAGHQSRLATCGAVPPCAACWVASAL